MKETVQKHYRTCNLCEAMCGLEIEHDGKKVLNIRGDAADVFSRGHICPKAVALQDLHEDPDRLRQPMLREGSSFRPISWDDAFELAGRKLAEVQKKHGKSAVAIYSGNPSVHHYATLLGALALQKTVKTRSKFSATSLDQLPHMFAALQMFGHQLMMPVPDIDNTRYMLILGGNPAVSNGSIMSAPGVVERLKGVKSRGKVVVIDPRFTETAEIASEHIFIRPAGDAAFVAAILNVIFAEKRENLGAWAEHTSGVEALRAAVVPFSPERVAASTGIPAETTRRIAREFSSANQAVAYGRIGICTQKFGGLAAWLINALNVVTAIWTGWADVCGPIHQSTWWNSEAELGKLGILREAIRA